MSTGGEVKRHFVGFVWMRWGRVWSVETRLLRIGLYLFSDFSTPFREGDIFITSSVPRSAHGVLVVTT